MVADPPQPPRRAGKKKKKQRHMPKKANRLNDFIEMETWGGLKEGYVYTTRAKGTGYYRETGEEAWKKK